MKARYITTTLPYVNADPHIGFALEIVQADALARFWRLTGDDVFFSTGTDEHGQKIFEAAAKSGEEVQAYVDRYAASFGTLKETLNLSYDNFIRTTDTHHEHAAQEMWRRCVAKGDIYKKKYQAPYCVGCEKFLLSKDLNEKGECPLHPGRTPEVLEEENYFFAFSRYQEQLLTYLSREGVVVPSFRAEEARQFVQNGLEDFSISREKSRMPWGIPVPNDDTQVMYVWFDALTNYISTLGWPCDEARGVHTHGCMFEKFWEQGMVVQTAGKDQVRFQSLMWQAMLMSADIKNTDTVFYHGFVTSGGQKMSKSIGNVINPKDIVARYGTEAVRYMLLRHVHPTDDSDITEERMDEWYTAHLVNGIGNLVARILKLSEVHLEAPIQRPEAGDFPSEYMQALNEYRFSDALDYVWKRIGALDEDITRTEPFKVIKTNREEGKRLIAGQVSLLYTIARLLHPCMPETGAIIKKAILANKKPDNLFPRLS